MFPPALMDTSIDGYELGLEHCTAEPVWLPRTVWWDLTWGNICPTQILPQMDPTWDYDLFCAVDRNSM